MQAASLQRQLLRGAVVAAGEPPPGIVERGVCRSIGRHIPHREACEFFQPEIGARIEPHHVHVFFEQLDERHEQCAVQAVLIKIVRRNVRGGDDHDAEVEQLREQPAEDHGIGNIGDMEFVEAKQPRLVEQLLGDKPNRIFAVVLAELHLLAQRENALVHVEHEFVKMSAALARHRACFEEQIHQHRLAAADVAVDVEALDRRLLAVAEQPAERRRFARQAMLRDPHLETRELRDDGELRVVAADAPRGDAGGVLRCNCARHRRGLTVVGETWREDAEI